MNKLNESLMNIDIDINSLMEQIPKDDDNVALYLRYNKVNESVSRTLISNKENIMTLLISLVFSENNDNSEDHEIEFYFRESMLNLSITILKEYSKENVNLFIDAVKENCL